MKLTRNSHEDIAIPIQYDWKLFKQLSQKRKKHKTSTSEDFNSISKKLVAIHILEELTSNSFHHMLRYKSLKSTKNGRATNMEYG